VEDADDLQTASREEAGRIPAVPAARLADAGLVEEIVQDAVIDALENLCRPNTRLRG
jgi:predicted RNA polymerase sigma factor